MSKKERLNVRNWHIRQITDLLYEPGRHDRCRKWIWSHYIRPLFGLQYQTYCRCLSAGATPDSDFFKLAAKLLDIRTRERKYMESTDQVDCRVGELYHFDWGERRGGMWGVFDGVRNGALCLEVASRDMRLFEFGCRLPATARVRVATHDEVRDFSYNQCYYEMAGRSMREADAANGTPQRGGSLRGPDETRPTGKSRPCKRGDGTVG